MNVEAWLAKADNKNSDDDEAEDDGEGDVAEVEFAAATGDFAVNFEEGESGDGEDEGELGDAEAGIADSIYTKPGVS